MNGEHRRARAIAFYLPQFHPIPENDEWWGKGFTEWVNVAGAQPLFTGHEQPHVPANLGYYDLRVPEIREAQAALARRYGIEAFCYWHYWFEGTRLLERPFEAVLASGRPDFPFCLAWANETWSRRWLGEERDVLIKQTYSPEDDVEHGRWLARAFADPRYLRVEGRPVFLIYRPWDLPDAEQTVAVFRRESEAAGVERPFLIGVNSHGDKADWIGIGFDSTLDFEPQLGALPGPLDDGLKIYDYPIGRRRMTERKLAESIPCIFVRWDNTPRRGEDGIAFINATPEHFESGLQELVESTLDRPYDRRLVFVNAWNEWAEGCHLEPDQRYGLEYLEAVSRTVLEPMALTAAARQPW